MPDSVLDLAEIELIDIAPDDLMRRLDEGKVYMPDRAAVAMVNFFREGNLTALREMALRLAAERVGQDVRDYMQVMQIQGPWKTGHRLLVAVSPSPFSAQMVRWTRRLADSLDARWMAVHVESSHPYSEEEQGRLTKNLALARELGAEVIATVDENLIRGIMRVARQQNVTQIVVGKPAREGTWKFFRRGWLLRRLVEESGDIDIHVVRADKSEVPKPTPVFRAPVQVAWKQYAISVGIIIGVTLANAFLDSFAHLGYRAAALDLLLAVVVLALFVGRGPVLVSATLSALLWDYFFLPPKYTFYIVHFDDAMMFGTYFVVAVVMGQLIARFYPGKGRASPRGTDHRALSAYARAGRCRHAGSNQPVHRLARCQFVPGRGRRSADRAGRQVVRPAAARQHVKHFSEGTWRCHLGFRTQPDRRPVHRQPSFLRGALPADGHAHGSRGCHWGEAAPGRAAEP